MTWFILEISTSRQVQSLGPGNLMMPVLTWSLSKLQQLDREVCMIMAECEAETNP